MALINCRAKNLKFGVTWEKGVEYGCHQLWWGKYSRKEINCCYSLHVKMHNGRQKFPWRIALMNTHGQQDDDDIIISI